MITHFYLRLLSGLFLFCTSILATSSANDDDCFNVNLWGFFGRVPDGGPELESVLMNPEQIAGVSPWQSDGWQNIQLRPSETEITSRKENSAKLKIVSLRNACPYRNLRNLATHENGNATILDSHMNTTEDPGDESNHGVIHVSDIPFKVYDVILYFGQNQGQQFDGKGTMHINEGPAVRYLVKPGEPDGILKEMTDPVTPGNYTVIRGLTDSVLKIRTYGEGFTHNGPAALQIVESNRARVPAKITKVAYSENKQELFITMDSFPGDEYSLRWSLDEQNWNPIGPPILRADSQAATTTFGPFRNPMVNSEELHFQIGSADFDQPNLIRAWGVGSRVVLEYSEPMLASVVKDADNFTLLDSLGGTLSLAGTDFGSNQQTVVLQLASPLSKNHKYTIATTNLVDRSGRELVDASPVEFRTWDDNPKGVKVFILAGQSNMQGFGESENGHQGKGKIGSLRYLVKKKPAKYGALVDRKGNWTARKDVQVWWQKSDLGRKPEVLKGALTTGFGTNQERIGPEYAFGQVVGDFYQEEPVLLVKVCWGGKSLSADFRSPSSVAKRGGNVGRYYLGMMDYLHNALDNLDTEFPQWKGRGYQFAGFAWHQGYNDRFTDFTASTYKENMADFIRDVRSELGIPNLPFCIATTGHEGFASTGSRLQLVKSQLEVADSKQFPEFTDNVVSADTRPFWREAEVSPGRQGHHWNHNAETYYEIGEALGEDMVKLLSKTASPKNR